MKKFVAMILIMACTISATADVKAYSFSDTSEKFGTKGSYQVKGNAVTDIPILGTCTMQSKGTADLRFKRNKSEYQKKFKNHSIQVDVGGIGGTTISMDGMELDLSSSQAQKSVDTYDWDYHIIVRKWRMFSYTQTHALEYQLRKGKKVGATVSLGGYYAWGF